MFARVIKDKHAPMKTNTAWYIQQLVDVTEEAMLIDQDNDHVIIC